MKRSLWASVRTLVAVVCTLAGISAAHAYTHPGIPLTSDDLAAIKANLGREPWKSGYAALAADSRSQLTYTMQGPFAVVSRNPHQNLTQWRNDMVAIWNLSRMWYFTGNTAYAQKAHDILLAWANTQTSFSGIEAPLDLGDYAHCWAGGADILRGTWPGWTQADTDKVKTLFGNVYQPIKDPNAMTLGPTNKGSLALSAAVSAAVFCDDQALFNTALRLYRTCASSGLSNTLSTGQHGETGRDQGHSYAHMQQMGFAAEVFWKHGVDVFSEKDNRVLALAEYYSRYNLGVSTPFIAMGTTDEYYTTDWSSFTFAGNAMGSSILKSAYVTRKGMSAPYLEQKLATQPVTADSFMFLKPGDTSTATPPAPVTYPGASLVSTGLTNIDINGASPAGSGNYSNGVWTVSGGGTDIWTDGAQKHHFLYKQITGDFSLVAKVNSVQNTHASAKAGVMVSSDLSADPGSQAWVAITPSTTVESFFSGWTEMYGGSNWRAQAYGLPQIPWWVKIERIGTVITTYASPDGVSWAVQVNGAYANMPAAAYVGLCVTSLVPGTLCTATFSNVSITGGNGVAPVAAPAAPLGVCASPGEGQVPLRWAESFGATSYKVKRSTTSGSGYATIATVTNPSYVDTAVTNGTTYYYVVSAVNAVGEGSNSPQDSAKPRSPMVNVAFGGTATASANNSGSEGSANAFDTNPGSKWFNGNTGSTGWIQYDFGSGVTQTIKRYTVNTANDAPGRDPKDWQFQGSNDGSAWTTLDTRAGQSFYGRYMLNSYDIANTTAYRYYRLNVTANNGDASGLQFSDLGLFTDQGRTIPNGTYRVLSRKSNKALDVFGGGTADGTDTIQWGYAGASNQKWTFTDLGNGQYQVLGLASGKALEVTGASTSNGAIIQIWPWNMNNCQKWTVTPVGNGSYKLLNVNSGKAIDVNGGSTADGAAIIQWPYGGSANQQWSISIAP